MPSYLVPALYYSTNLSDVVLALLGPWYLVLYLPSAMCFSLASAVLTSDGSRPNRAKEGRTSFMRAAQSRKDPPKRYDGDHEDAVGGGGGFGRDCSSFHMTMEVYTCRHTLCA